MTGTSRAVMTSALPGSTVTRPTGHTRQPTGHTLWPVYTCVSRRGGRLLIRGVRLPVPVRACVWHVPARPRRTSRSIASTVALAVAGTAPVQRRRPSSSPWSPNASPFSRRDTTARGLGGGGRSCRSAHPVAAVGRGCCESAPLPARGPLATLGAPCSWQSRRAGSLAAAGSGTR
jgi:hypothetical protein